MTSSWATNSARRACQVFCDNGYGGLVYRSQFLTRRERARPSITPSRVVPSYLAGVDNLRPKDVTVFLAHITLLFPGLYFIYACSGSVLNVTEMSLNILRFVAIVSVPGTKWTWQERCHSVGHVLACSDQYSFSGPVIAQLIYAWTKRRRQVSAFLWIGKGVPSCPFHRFLFRHGFLISRTVLTHNRQIVG